MNPKISLSLAGLSLALSVMAQVENTVARDYDFDDGHIGGPYTDGNKASATQGFGPDGRVGGLFTATTPHSITTNLTTTLPAKATNFECGIHRLTSKDPVPMNPVASPMSKHATDTTKLIDPIWSNATETAIFSINPITPTGPQQMPTPGTSPICTTLVSGASKNWNGTDVGMPFPTGTHTIMTVQALNETSVGHATRIPVPNPNGRNHGHDEGDDVEEAKAAKAGVISVGAIIAALLVAYGN